MCSSQTFLRSDPQAPAKRTVLLVGATGLVGGQCLRYLQEDPGVDRIVVLTRRPLATTAAAANTEEILVDFERLRDYSSQFAVDQVFICLGTTRKAAGSKEAFARVDHGLVLAVARLAAENKVADLLLISSLGADALSPFFYLRTKGRLEADVTELPFRSIVILRAAYLVGKREKVRVGEVLVAKVGALFSLLFVGHLKKYQPIDAADVARAMVRLAAAPDRGVRILDSREIRIIAEAPAQPVGS
jgi:uncharacterized protein YbjT (DUF2867 family)